MRVADVQRPVEIIAALYSIVLVNSATWVQELLTAGETRGV
jgi:hypothetical protein